MTLRGGAHVQRGLRTSENLTDSDLHPQMFTINFICGLTYYENKKDKTIK